MAIQSTTLRPGLLVSLKTSITGNIAYAKATIEAEHLTETGAERARWETTRTITDPEEYKAAEIARAKVSSLVRGVCAKSAFGLLCPESDAGKLESAIVAAREVAEAFNAGAKLSRIGVYVITGRIAPDDAEAVRAINSEIRDLLNAMESGVRNLDVEAIRAAASRARSVGAMLPAETVERVQGAIDAARKAAREIVKAGETAGVEIDLQAVRAITDARTAFLEIEPAAEPAAPAEIAPAIDLEPESAPNPFAAAEFAPAMEF